MCATGYAAADYLGQIDVVGENGVSLHDTWRDGAFAYLGMAVPGFPNFFMLYGPNTNVGSNSVIFVLEAQAHYIVRALETPAPAEEVVCRRCVRDATADFIAKIDKWMEGTVWTTRCSNYFRVANGRVVTQWPRSARAFWGMTRRFRASDYALDGPEPQSGGVDVADSSGRIGSTWSRLRTWTSPNAWTRRCGTWRRHAPTCRRMPSARPVRR